MMGCAPEDIPFEDSKCTRSSRRGRPAESKSLGTGIDPLALVEGPAADVYAKSLSRRRFPAYGA